MKQVPPGLLKITLLLIAITLGVNFLIVAKNILVPVVVAILGSFLVFPFVSWLENRLRFPRLIAAVVSLIMIIFILTGIGWFFGAQITSFAEDFSMVEDRYQKLKEGLPPIVREWLENFSPEKLLGYLEANIESIFSGLTGVIGSITMFYLVPIYIVLMLMYRDMFYDFLLRVFQPKNNKTGDGGNNSSGVDVILPNVRNISRQYITGMFYVMCVLFVLNSIALLIIGVKHAFLFAAFAAILNIVPFIGPLVGSSLPILFALITMDSLWAPFAVFASFLFIQTLESNLITPGIVGKNVSLNPLVTLITLFVGASIWGVIGMILFIPLVAILKELFNHIPALQPFADVMGTGTENGNKSQLLPKVKEWISDKKEDDKP